MSLPYFSTYMEPRNRFQGMNSASLCSLAGRYDNPIPTRCPALIDFFKNSSSSRHQHINYGGVHMAGGGCTCILCIPPGYSTAFRRLRIKRYEVTQVRTPGFFHLLTEAGTAKNYCATNSGSPEVDLRYDPWLM